MLQKDTIRQKGQILIMALVFMLILLTLAGIIFGFVTQNVRATRAAVAREQALQLAEAAIEKAVWQLNQTAGSYSGETGTVLGSGVFDAAVSPVSATLKEITGTGYAPNKTSPKATRTIKVAVSIETQVVSFVYGVHIGSGGLAMENSSQVLGNVYSHGPISMKNTAQITGDVFAATTSEISGQNTPTITGNAHAHAASGVAITGNASSTTDLSSVDLGGNAHADTILSSTIGQDAFYFTGISGSSVGGSLHPGTAPPAELPEVAFEITDSQIADWETQAEAGGVYTGPCPYKLTSGITSLGPLKINCDFSVENTAEVTLNGPLWVVGTATVKNSASVRLAASYGGRSEVIIADNPANRLTSSKIAVEDSAQVLGSGATGSYIALISQNNSAETGGGETAVQPKNAADGSIYYALHGKIAIDNTTTLKEASAYLIRLKNTAVLTYESGLASALFTAGSGASWTFQRGTWREIK